MKFSRSMVFLHPLDHDSRFWHESVRGDKVTSNGLFLHLAHEELFVGLLKSGEMFRLFPVESGEDLLHGRTTALG